MIAVRLSILLAMILGWSTLSVAQIGGQVSEEDVALEREFIEAHQQKLLGRLDKALPLYEELHRKNRDNAVIPYEMARIYHEQSDAEMASRYIQRSLDIDPDNVWYLEFSGDLLSDQSQFLEAAKVYEQLHTISPTSELYLHELSVAYANGGAYREALDVLERWEAIAGIEESIVRRKIDIYQLLGDDKGPINELKKLIKYKPENLEYQNNLALYYEQRGDQKKAAKLYNKVLDEDAENVRASTAMLRLKAGDQPMSSTTVLKQIVYSNSASIDEKIAALIDPVYQTNAADSTLESMLLYLAEDNQFDPKTTAILADYYMNAKDYHQAVVYYKKTLQSNRNIYGVWDQLMVALDATADYDQLYTTAEQAIDYFPNQASAYYYLGKATLIDQQEPREAIDWLMEASMIAGKNDLIKYKCFTYLAQAYLDISDNTRAKKYLDQALAINADGNPILEKVQQSLGKS